MLDQNQSTWDARRNVTSNEAWENHGSRSIPFSKLFLFIFSTFVSSSRNDSRPRNIGHVSLIHRLKLDQVITLKKVCFTGRNIGYHYIYLYTYLVSSLLCGVGSSSLCNLLITIFFLSSNSSKCING